METIKHAQIINAAAVTNWLALAIDHLVHSFFGYHSHSVYDISLYTGEEQPDIPG
jgi:hypothetical protein